MPRERRLLTGRVEMVDWERREVPEVWRKLELTVRGGMMGAKMFPL